MSALALASVATCNLCQWAMEFEVNLLNVCKSIDIAKRRGCTLRTGPELELTGYIVLPLLCFCVCEFADLISVAVMVARITFTKATHCCMRGRVWLASSTLISPKVLSFCVTSVESNCVVDIDNGSFAGILCDIGMPLMHDGVRYNCRVFVLNRQIVLIRPKVVL
jgi:NAD+ synthase (glutamine-hydrolysing)